MRDKLRHEGNRELADHYGFSVLEDASHAIGGSYDGETIGTADIAQSVYLAFTQ